MFWWGFAYSKWVNRGSPTTEIFFEKLFSVRHVQDKNCHREVHYFSPFILLISCFLKYCHKFLLLFRSLNLTFYKLTENLCKFIPVVYFVSHLCFPNCCNYISHISGPIKELTSLCLHSKTRCITCIPFCMFTVV